MELGRFRIADLVNRRQTQTSADVYQTGLQDIQDKISEGRTGDKIALRVNAGTLKLKNKQVYF
jgi:hypothetical protein